MKHNVTIKATGLSPEEVQKLIDSLDTPNFKVTIKPVLRQTDVSHSSGDTIEDGFGGFWSKRCPMCSRNGMQVMRPGKVQCRYCG